MTYIDLVTHPISILIPQKGSFFKKYTFESDQPIGDGSFSICMKCVNNNTEKEYAVKILRKDRNVAAEIDALNACHGHSNIVSIVEVIEDDAFTYIITEWLAGKELFKYVQEQTLNECEARGIFKEILHAVTHMHSQNIAHRDLKLENIKFTNENTNKSSIKILDFGFACKINDNDSEMEGACYTLDYAAPEILSNKKYTESCDLWSLGVILYALLCGSLPFRRQNGTEGNSPNSQEQITYRIKHGKIDFNNKRWVLLSDSAKDLVRRLLTVSPEKRIKLSVSFSRKISIYNNHGLINWFMNKISIGHTRARLAKLEESRLNDQHFNYNDHGNETKTDAKTEAAVYIKFS